jgi:Protein of unknown function (DUF3617)
MTKLRALMLAAVVVAASHAAVAADGPQPGLWKVTTITHTGGAKQQDSHTSCLTPEMAKNPEKEFARSPQATKDCKQSRKISGSTLSWQMECSGQYAMTGTGTMTFDSPQHYTGTFKMSVAAGPRPMDIVTTMEGQRVGECQK